MNPKFPQCGRDDEVLVCGLVQRGALVTPFFSLGVTYKWKQASLLLWARLGLSGVDMEGRLWAWGQSRRRAVRAHTLGPESGGFSQARGPGRVAQCFWASAVVSTDGTGLRELWDSVRGTFVEELSQHLAQSKSKTQQSSSRRKPDGMASERSHE